MGGSRGRRSTIPMNFTKFVSSQQHYATVARADLHSKMRAGFLGRGMDMEQDHDSTTFDMPTVV